jgi:hypothetical protein
MTCLTGMNSVLHDAVGAEPVITGEAVDAAVGQVRVSAEETAKMRRAQRFLPLLHSKAYVLGAAYYLGG